MINMVNFTKRLQKVIEYYDESASSFAEKIGVQRSSISHILSGRNRPSLDFVLKVLSAYPEVELYWLLNGKGVFPAITNTSSYANEPKSLMFSEKEHKSVPKSSKEISKIVIFYTDGSFEDFEK